MFSKLADNSIKVWQIPAPVSIVGTVAFSRTNLIRFLLPRGIKISINLSASKSSPTNSRLIGKSCTQFLFNPKDSKTSWIIRIIALLEFSASEPPLKTTAFPDFKAKTTTSTVTFGRD